MQVAGAVADGLLVAGGLPAAPSPTALSLPASATASAAPPSATATLAPPTSTATRTPSPLPPVPTANFAAADIQGTWTRTDPARGVLYLTLSSTGSYQAAHGAVDSSVHSGTYTLDGRLLTFVDGWNCAPAETTPGQYVLRLAGGGQWLYLDQYVDECPDRPAALTGFRWDRYEAP